MNTRPASVTSSREAVSSRWPEPAMGGPDARANTPGQFGQVMAQVSSNNSPVTIQKGDTLVGIVTQHYKSQGLAIDGRRAYREALLVAQSNGIRNPNHIQPGAQVQVAGPDWRAPEVSTVDALRQRAVNAAPKALPEPQAMTDQATPLLDQTLKRAVEKGFVAPTDVASAKAKVQALSEKFGFEPDHFALLTLMESGGMNPQASNGRCHGIIQFCEGQGRGAASVGMAGQAKRILGMGLIMQLDLVEKYFQDLGMEQSGKKIGLDDLYLSVLTPAARQETRRHVPLAIPGRQALDLYANGSVQQGITRESIVQGLMNMARRIFPEWQPNKSHQEALARQAPPHAQ